MDSTLTGRTVGEIAAEVPAAIRVFEKLNIDYCCGGATPLTDACSRAGISIDAFLQALEGADAPEADIDWTTRPLAELTRYLVDRYHVHAREELATLTLLAAKVVSVHGGRHPELKRVGLLVNALEQDMLPHMMKEEMVLFPYVENLEAGNATGSCFGTVENPIRVMSAEHEQVGDILRQLRITTDGYAIPPDGCFSYTQLYRRLEELERETHQHIHLENNIYFPRAIELEQLATV